MLIPIPAAEQNVLSSNHIQYQTPEDSDKVVHLRDQGKQVPAIDILLQQVDLAP
jgi:hypothetical protein